MGRTLLGVDLDESAVGGFVERLLTDQELEMLADGGRPDDDGANGDGSADSGTATDEGAEVDPAADGGVDEDPDAASESDVTADDAAHLSSASGAVTGEAADDRVGRGVPSVDPGSDEPHMGDAGDENGGGRLAKFKPLLIKGAVALVVLAVIGVVVWKYGGKIRSKLPAKLGGTSDGAGDESGSPDDLDAADADVSSARRRAKASHESDTREHETSRAGERSASTVATEPTGAEKGRDEEESGRESAAAGATGGNADVGALVGLGLLAVVAAIVRKVSEEPPSAPLVDGPQDEG